MDQAPETKPGIDYIELAENMDSMREVLRVVIAGLVADGFTDEQARRIIVGSFDNKEPKP